jgi:hypothetical protein
MTERSFCVHRRIQQLLLQVDQPTRQINILPLGCDTVLLQADLRA